jgi:hypothetical protein
MARSSPEKLAAALRANLKRRKEGQQAAPKPAAQESLAESTSGDGKSPVRISESGH